MSNRYPPTDEEERILRTLGRILEQERERQGLLQVQVVQRMSGPKHRTALVSRVEGGYSNPTFRTLHRMTQALGMTMVELVIRLETTLTEEKQKAA